MDMLLWILIGVLGVFFGVGIFLFTLPLIPTAIERLSNHPNRLRGKSTGTDEYPVDHFGFFTKLAPGQVKIIEAGDRFLRCIMRFDGHTFAGFDRSQELVRNRSGYWEVIPTSDGQDDAHPITRPLGPVRLFNLFIWIWASWVYSLTGYVFIGLYPWRRVRTYPIKRFKTKKLSNGSEETYRVDDYSDHFRVADFQFPVVIPETDTQDMMQVRVHLDGLIRVSNPYLAAYHTDDWAERAEAAITDRVTAYTRPRPLSDILAAQSEEDSEHLALAVKSIGDPSQTTSDTITVFGLKLVQVLVTDISPVETTSNTKKRISDLAFARIERKSAEERAHGDAAQLARQIEVVKEGGPAGFAVLASERNVRTAKAAGEKGIVVVGGASEVDPIQTAMLHELRDINLRKQLTLEE